MYYWSVTRPRSKQKKSELKKENDLGRGSEYFEGFVELALKSLLRNSSNAFATKRRLGYVPRN